MRRPGLILHPEQEAYLASRLPAADEVVQAMDREGRENGVPIVDREVGYFLELLVRLHRPKRVLEVGTAIGFSGLFILRALQAEGHLWTVDVDAERQARAAAFFDRDGHAGRYTLVHQPILEALPSLDGPWDMVFVDGLKVDYRPSLEALIPRMPSGGLIVCDNLLWGGQVAAEVWEPDAEASTAALREFNLWFTSHPELRAQITPIGDGTGLAVKY